MEDLQAQLDAPEKSAPMPPPTISASSEPPISNPYGSFPVPAPPIAVRLRSGLGVKGAAGVKWKGIVRDAILDGVVVHVAYSIVIDAQETNMWEALDWKILKENKSAVIQYGLKSPYTQSILQYIFLANFLTPHDRRMTMRMLSPSQQIQFFQYWHQGCDNAAAVPWQQGDPLYGVQTQMLLGEAPFARPDWQANFATEVLHLSQDLAFKVLASAR